MPRGRLAIAGTIRHPFLPIRRRLEGQSLTGIPDTGQGLAAQSWDVGETTVTLGTADADALEWCEPGWEFPASWSSCWDVDDTTTVIIESYLSDGLALDLPGLTAGEGGQIHFAVAWAPTWREDSATWFAVDINPERAARLLGAA